MACSATSSTRSRPVNFITAAEESRRTVVETVRCKIDHLGSILGSNGMELQALRASNRKGPSIGTLVDDDTPAPLDYQYVVPFTDSGKSNKKVTQQAFLLCANKVYRLCHAFWLAVETHLPTLSQQLTLDQSKAIELEAGKVVEYFGKNFPGLAFVIDGAVMDRAVEVIRAKGPVPDELSFSDISYYSLQDPIVGLDSWQTKLLNYSKATTQTNFIAIVFESGPNQKEFNLISKGIKFVPLKDDPQNCMRAEHRFEMKPLNVKIADVAEVFERRCNKLSDFINTESIAISTLLDTLKLWHESQRKLTDAPKAPLNEPVLSSESYRSSIAMQKRKTKRVVQSALAEVPAPSVGAPKQEVVIQKPKVVLKNKHAYETFCKLMGASNERVTWNETVHCLRAIGFSVIEPQAGGNTWKFKWQHQFWLRDEQTLEQLFGDGEVQDNNTATSSFHEPHQNGLNTQGYMDYGRVSSFKKLLAECLLDLECVTLKK